MTNLRITYFLDLLCFCVPGLCRIRRDLVELGMTEKVAHRLPSEVGPLRGLVD
jgi:hypothetical protein